MSFFENRSMARSSTVIMVLAAVGSLYCLAAGFFMLGSWQDPFATATSAELSRASVQGRGRGGVILLAIRYWPWALIAFGAYFGFHQLRILGAFDRLTKHLRR